MNEKKQTYSIKSVDRALCILEAISEETGAFGTSHLSAKLGMDKSYVFRMLATFEKRGYVQKIKSSSRYRAGLTAFETGSKFLNSMQLLQKAKPVMEQLAKKTAEAVYLAVPGEDEFLLVDMVDSAQQVRVIPLVGRRYPLDQFSAGKVVTTQTAECLSDVGAVGEGIGSLAVPVLDATDEVCASICLIGPEFRFQPEIIEQRLLPQVRAAGDELSAKLGYASPEYKQGRAGLYRTSVGF